MPSSRLIAILTALMCLTRGSEAVAGYTIQQLRDIDRLIGLKDCGALRLYLDRNPVMLSGTDVLSSELRNFARGVDTGLIECLSMRPAPVARLLATPPGPTAQAAQY